MGKREVLRLHLLKRTGININVGNERRVYHIGIEMTNELIAYVEEEKNRPVETQEGRRAANDTVECLVSRGGYCYNIRKGYYSQQFSVGSGGRE